MEHTPSSDKTKSHKGNLARAAELAAAIKSDDQGDRRKNDRLARREALRSARPKATGAELLELSEISTKTRRRNYHERTHRHYSLVIGKIMTALGAPDCAQDFITGLLTVIGYDVSPSPDVAPGVDLTDKEFAARTVGKTHRLPADQYKKLLEREAERRRKQRRTIREWQDLANNPILFDYDGEFNKKTGKNNSRYTLPVAELVRASVAEAPVGSREIRIDRAVSKHCSDYLQCYTGTSHRPVITREHSASSEISRGLTLVKNGYTKIYSTELTKLKKETRPDADQLAEQAAAEAFADAFFERYPLDRYPKLHTTLLAKLRQKLGVNPCPPPDHFAGGHPEIGHTPPDRNMSNFGDHSEPDEARQESDPSEISSSETPMPYRAPIVGQAIEEFIAETFGDEGDPDAWRKLPTTPKQRDLLLRGDVFDIPATRGVASDRINEILADGALCDWLSLTELESFDPRAGGHSKMERRFCCPLCGGSKPLDSDHRSLSANTESGAYYCHRCHAGGKLREYREPTINGLPARQFLTLTLTPTPTPKPADDRWRQWVAEARPINGTPGAAYLESRGVSIAAAEAAGVKFGKWWRRNDEADKPEAFEAVIFPIRNLAGDLVAAQARAIVGGDKITRGEKSAGVFCATSSALDAKVIAITEAPIDALVLAAGGLDAIALCGTSWPTWLPDALAGCDILLATDADADGDRCAATLATEMQGRASCRRLRPQNVKDWAELADLEGLDSVRTQITEILACAAAVAGAQYLHCGLAVPDRASV